MNNPPTLDSFYNMLFAAGLIWCCVIVPLIGVFWYRLKRREPKITK